MPLGLWQQYVSLNSIAYKQVMTDGIGPMSAMPTFLAKLGVKVRIPSS